MEQPREWSSRVTLLRADYRETLQAATDAGGVDLVLTSPPYCDARGYGDAVVWTLADYADLGDHVARALKPGGWALVNVDAPVRQLFEEPRDYVARALRDGPFRRVRHPGQHVYIFAPSGTATGLPSTCATEPYPRKAA